MSAQALSVTATGVVSIAWLGSFFLMRTVRAICIVWKGLWCFIALPFAYAILLCALVGSGYTPAKQWAEDNGLPFP